MPALSSRPEADRDFFPPEQTHQVHTYMPLRARGADLTFSLQDTWHKDQQLFDEDQLQSLSSMLVGTSYCKSFLPLCSCAR